MKSGEDADGGKGNISGICGWFAGTWLPEKGGSYRGGIWKDTKGMLNLKGQEVL